MKFNLEKGYTGEITLAESFFAQTMDTLDYNELKVYLKLCLYCRLSKDAKLSDVAHDANVNPEEMPLIMSSLEKKGIINVEKDCVKLVGSNNAPKKSLNLDDFSCDETEDIKIIASAAETAFGKLLSHADLNAIMGIYKFIGLPKEVFVLAIEYCCSLGKKNFNYIEKTLITWKEAGVESATSAHEYLREAEEKEQYYQKLKQSLGIYGFNLTKKQKEFADKWKKDFSIEQIVVACEKTIDGTGKISFAHTDKVLYNPDYTYQAGGSTAKVIKATRFTNFDQGKSDYDDVEKKALEKLMNRKKGD